MKTQSVLLFNNKRYFKKRAEKFITRQIRKRSAWKNVEIRCVESFRDFSRELDTHPDLIIINYYKQRESASQFMEERLLTHLRNEVPEAKVVIISKNHSRLRKLFNNQLNQFFASGENILQQMFLALQTNMMLETEAAHYSDHRYYQFRDRY